MNLEKEVIAYAIKNTDSPESAADLLAKFQRCSDAVMNRDNEIRAINKAAKEKIDRLKAQQLCGHEVRKSDSDPSGGSDRSVMCMICGEWLYATTVRFT
jgi:hypothetical protein